MDLDQLRDPWSRTNGGTGTDPDLTAIIAKAKGLERDVGRRDRIEVAAGAIAGGLFAWFGFETTYLGSKIGAAILVGCCVLIPFRLRRARRPPPDPTAEPLQVLRHELDRVTAQRDLLRTVAWWYLGPIYLGVVLFVVGASPTWLGIVYTVAAGGFMLVLWRLNLAAARDLGSRATEIEALIHGLSAGGG